MSDSLVMCSGGFDPPHIGHLCYLRSAADYGLVLVVLNSDEWLLRKKGHVNMPWDERRELLSEWRCVWRVVSVDDEDGTVCRAVNQYRPRYFANGGDVTSTSTREAALCRELGVQLLHGVGGSKIRSSREWRREVGAP